MVISDRMVPGRCARIRHRPTPRETVINPAMAKFRAARRDIRGNFLRVAPVVWCMTITRRGDPSQKSGAIRGPFRSLVLSETIL